LKIEERDIIDGCIKGNRTSQKALYDYYSSKMYYACLRYATDKEEAEDILQEGFVKVFQNISTFSGNGSFEGWIRRIIVNTAIEHFRKKNMKFADAEIENAIDQSHSVTIVDHFSEQDLLKIISQLPIGYKTVFNLYAIEGFSHKEIADMLKITESTSKSQLSRARGMLQEKLKLINQNSLIKS
jgi:RNA polymerase sigma factor (sigma-70 family)